MQPSSFTFVHRHRIRLVTASLLVLMLAVLSLVPNYETQAQTTPSFNSSGLQGESLTNPTSLQFGPDDRLYVSQQNGYIYAYIIERDNAAPGDGTYTVTATEEIDLIKFETPNHNDNGTVNTTTNRQVTGILLTGTASNPVMYVSSSDWRIAVGNDSGLDTNSGVVSRLTWNGNSWDRVDIVRGFARSEENHSVNGMALDEANNMLYLQVGGHNNKGAPGNNFAGTPEYWTSGAMVSIDLDMIESMPIYTDARYGNQFVYDLPTLDDPTRANITNSDPNFPYPSNHPLYNEEVDPGDPFGGNNGLNQAITEPGGPVQIYSPGYRNAYDVVFTQSGNIYTWDNGPNTNWGGMPVLRDSNNNDAIVSVNYNNNNSNYNTAYDPDSGIYCTGEFNDAGSQGHGDTLAFVDGEGYYGGHPVPIRAFPRTAGIYIYEENGDVDGDGDDDDDGINGDWDLVDSYQLGELFPAYMDINDSYYNNNPIQCEYTASDASRHLHIIGSSTNGLAEYTASAFGGAMEGDLLAASFNGNIARVQLNADGSDVTNVTNNFFSGFGATPLDITTQDDTDIFPGTIWAATYGADNITIFEPTEVVTCDDSDDDTIDADGDGYTNADEIDNGTDPCSGGSQPNDFDDVVEFNGFKLSDLNDTDDDNDGILDVDDAFAQDASNGMNNDTLPVLYPFWNNDPGTGFFGLGFTGLMTNGTTDYLDQFDEAEQSAGGATGKYTIDAVTPGDAWQGSNNQDYAFQFGFNANNITEMFVIHTEMEPPFFDGSGPSNFQSQGFYIGTGDQDNYLKIVLNGNNGNGELQVAMEVNGQVSSGNNVDQGVSGLLNSGVLDLYFLIDPVNNTAQARYSTDSGVTINDFGPLFNLPSSWMNGGDALAVGIIATSFNSTPFTATWDFINIIGSSPAVGNPLADIERPVSQSDEQIVINLDDVFTDDGGLDGLTFSVQVDSTDNANLFSQAPAVGNIVGEGGQEDLILNFAGGEIGTADLTVSVQDEDGMNASDTFTVTVVDNAPLLYRINAGGPTVTDADLDWMGNPNPVPGDFPYLVEGGGNAFGTSNGISVNNNNTGAPNAIFNNERWDPPAAPPMTWAFPAQPGTTAVVRLYVMEGFSGNASTGARIFDVEVEGSVPNVFNGIDPFALGGAAGVPSVLEAEVIVGGDGDIDLVFLHDVENPAIRGIEIFAFPPEDDGNVAPVLENPGNQSNDEGDTPDLFIQWTDENNGDNVTFTAEGLPPGLDIEPTNAHIFGTIADGAAANSPYTVTVTGEDDGDLSDEVTFTWVINDPDATTTVLYRVNNGGGELTDSPMNWSADQSAGLGGPQNSVANGTATTGTPSQYLTNPEAGDTTFGPTNFTITNNTSVPDNLFAHERFSAAANPNNMQWAFPVSEGDYIVNLYFAENWTGAQTAGVRVFDVEVEGSLFLDDYDVYVAAGGINVAIVESTQVTVTDGTLNIDFIKGVQNPAIKGIEILTVNGGTGNQAPFVVNPIDDITVTEGDPLPNITIFDIANDDNSVFNDDSQAAQYLTYTPSSSNTDLVTTSINNEVLELTYGTGTGTATITLDAQDSDGAVGTTSFTVTVNEEIVIEDGEVLFRVNVGGPQLTAEDNSEPVWGQDQGNFGTANNSPYLAANSTGGSTYNGGSNSAHPGPIDTTDPSIPASVPDALFNTERYDQPSAPEMLWQFPIAEGTEVEVRLYFAELFGQITAAGQRVFDVNVEGTVPAVFDDIDPFARNGAKGAFMLSHVVTVDADSTLDIEFIHGVENPALKGIEIVAVGGDDNTPPEIATNLMNEQNVSVSENGELDFAVTLSDVDTNDTLTLNTTIVDENQNDVSSALTVTPNANDIYDVTLAPLANSSGSTYTLTLEADDGTDTTTLVLEIAITDPRTLTITAPTAGVTITGDSVTVSWTTTGADPTPRMGFGHGDHIHIRVNEEIGSEGERTAIYDANLLENGSYELSITNGDPLVYGENTIEVVMAAPMHSEYDQTRQTVTFTLEEAVNVATLNGTVDMQALADDTATITVGLYQDGVPTPVYEFTPTTDSDGNFTVTGIAPDEYEVAVKHANHLQVVETITLVVGENTADFGTLLAGDVDDNNIVELSDFSILAGVFALVSDENGFDARADLNADGTVTLEDFSLLAGNFNAIGEEPSNATP